MKQILTIFPILALVIISSAITEGGCVITPPGPDNDDVTQYGYEIVAEYPHDSEAFTQGLVYEDGYLYESTGLKGHSTVRKVEIATGVPTLMVYTPDLSCSKGGSTEVVFGEGITLWGDNIIQLTWQCERGVIYDKTTFAELDQFTYDTEGWGITHDGTQLIVSDGTNVLQFWDPVTFQRTDTLPVFEGTTPIIKLNELEYINGFIYANVWETDDIVIIDPETGQVRGRIDLAGLKPDTKQRGDVLNGIAYDADNDRFFVTGKLWPKLFEIILIEETP